jgi:hypothetical protein
MDEHWRRLERMYHGNPTNAWHGATLRIEEGRCVGRGSGTFLPSELRLDGVPGYADPL